MPTIYTRIIEALAECKAAMQPNKPGTVKWISRVTGVVTTESGLASIALDQLDFQRDTADIGSLVLAFTAKDNNRYYLLFRVLFCGMEFLAALDETDTSWYKCVWQEYKVNALHTKIGRLKDFTTEELLEEVRGRNEKVH